MIMMAEYMRVCVLPFFCVLMPPEESVGGGTVSVTGNRSLRRVPVIAYIRAAYIVKKDIKKRKKFA